MKGDLTVERFPPELKDAAKIAAIRRGQTFREWLIEVVAAAVEAAQEVQPVGHLPPNTVTAPPGGRRRRGAR